MKASTITEVIILYNPISTGDSKKNAEELAGQLTKASKSLKVRLKKTEYAKHAEKLAGQYAKNERSVLLISSSGDGGYNELINGVLSSGASTVYTSVLPSGNANDHYKAVGTDALVEHIVSGTVRHIDAIRVTSQVNGKPWVRYAHSYVGIGLTPFAGKELTKEKLNFFNEKWIVIKNLFKFRHVSIRFKGKKVRYSSLIFSNIDRMSKILTLSKSNSMNDGKFEINALRYQSKFYLIMHLFKAASVGLEEDSSLSSFEFKTIKRLLIQLDGEDFTFDGDSTVTIESLQNALTIVA